MNFEKYNIPLTVVSKKTDVSGHVLLNSSDSGLAKTSIALCENVKYISKDNIGRYITTLPEAYMQEIAKAIMTSLALFSYLAVDEFLYSLCLRQRNRTDHI